jgi:hypothetical protein
MVRPLGRRQTEQLDARQVAAQGVHQAGRRHPGTTGAGVGAHLQNGGLEAAQREGT